MYRLGIDLGGTNIKFVILDDNNNIVLDRMTPTPKNAIAAGKTSEDYRCIEDAMINSVKEMLAEKNISPAEIKKAGITVPGVTKVPKGPVLLAPNIGWQDHDPISYLEEKLGMDFVIGNDADCMALAENALGTGKNFNSFVMLTLGTGVGGAIVYDNKIFTGFTNFGGELGHIPLVHGGHPCNCGQNGCFEQYASATALKRITFEISGKNMEPIELFKELERGDKTAEEIVDTYVRYLCEGITGFINVLRPDGIILGGGVANSGAPLFDRVNKLLPTMGYCRDLIPVPPVVPAALGMFSGAIGATFL